MSHMTTLSRQKKLVEFAEKAARWFASHPEGATYSANNPEPGGYLALRWGLDNDCVLVVKLDEDFTPINFQQAVREVA